MATTAKPTQVAAGRSGISVGIGSWTDAAYKGLLYPRGLPDHERLKTYATFFDHVEVNASYHRVPPRAFVENWAKQTPPGFLFDVKLPRPVSANPARAARPGGPVAQLLRVMQPLVAAKKLGAFFLVLPPSFGPEKHVLTELDGVIEMLRPHLLAVELRHSGWVAGAERARTLEFYRSRGLVWINVDMPRIAGSTIMPPLDVVTNPKLGYLRLHGRRPDWLQLKDATSRHTYAYSETELRELAARVRVLAKKARAVHVVANNHAQDFAPKTALALRQLLARGAPTKPTSTGDRAKTASSAAGKVRVTAPTHPRRKAASPPSSTRRSSGRGRSFAKQTAGSVRSTSKPAAKRLLRSASSVQR